MQDIFLIICTGYFGDVLLTSKLTKDIKKFYPDSKLVYICDKPYVSVVKNMPCVDEVFPYDRKSKKMLFSFFRFVLKFPYKRKINHAFIIHQNKKSRIFLAKLLGAKNITTWESFKAKDFYKDLMKNYPEHSHVAYFNADMLSDLTNKKTDATDIEFLVPENAQRKIDTMLNLYRGRNLIAVNPQTTDKTKCWDVKEFVSFVKKIIQKGYVPVLTGLSSDGINFLDALKNVSDINQSDYINLFDKTDFSELGAVYKRCSFVVSIDTGSAHMACAVGAKTLVLFFKNVTKLWAPINVNKNSFIYGKSISADEVIQKMDEMQNIVLE